MIVHGSRVGRKSGIGSRDSRRLIRDCSMALFLWLNSSMILG